MPLPDYKALLWLDIETTGLDPGCYYCNSGDLIVEIATTPTRTDLEQPSDPAWRTQHWYVGTFSEALAKLATCDPVVFQMHQANGLLTDLATPDRRIMSASQVQDEILNQVQHLTYADGTTLKQHEVALAGSGVGHFDSAFLRRWMPLLADWLHPSPFDLGPIRRAVKMWAPGWIPNSNDAKPHRAPADVEIHLSDAREIRDRFRAAGAFASLRHRQDLCPGSGLVVADASRGFADCPSCNTRQVLTLDADDVPVIVDHTPHRPLPPAGQASPL